MKIATTRFILSVMSIAILGALAFYAIMKGDAISPPLVIPTIGGIAGYYTYGKTKNNDTFINNTK